MTPLDFAKGMLLTLGAPVIASNLQALTAWMQLEGGHYNNGARYNPLNTTQHMPGSYNPGFNQGANIQRYVDWEQGLAATIKTLKDGATRFHYSRILDALQTDADADSKLRAINSTDWGTKNYHGNVQALSSYAYRSDPYDGQGGTLSILSGPASFIARFKSRAPYIAGLTVVAIAGYFLVKK